MKRIRFFIPIVIVSTLVAANPAQASKSERQIVHYGDLDLGSPQGVATLDKRIKSAVDRVCGRGYPQELQSARDARRCRAETLADVRAQRSKAIAANPGSTQLASQR